MILLFGMISFVTNLIKTNSEKVKSSANSKLVVICDEAHEQLAEEIEDKIEDYRDKYVKKFSAMETAMAKLQSQTSAMSSFFGTGM